MRLLISHEEIVEIDVAFNEIYTININNNKEPQEEIKEIETTKEITVTGKKEIALPRTGF